MLCAQYSLYMVVKNFGATDDLQSKTSIISST